MPKKQHGLYLTLTQAILNKIWVIVAAKMFFFLMELGVWGLMGYSIFYQYLQGHGCKNPGNPMIMIFSRGFYLKLYFSRGGGVNFNNYSANFIQGGRLKNFFRYHFFPRD